MTIAIHQPNYLPWMGYFNKMAKADTFVIFDDVQLPMSGHAYETRCVIKGPLELNIPVERRGHSLIKDTKIAGNHWRGKHLKSLTMNYKKSDRLDELKEIYSRDWKYLLEFDIALICLLSKWLGIKSRLILSSDLKIEGRGGEKILNIVKALNCDTYVSGTGSGSRKYINEAEFAQHGINVVWHSYSGANISAVDSVLN